MTLLLVHAAATLFMAGLIWFVQLVHYPLFALVGERDYATFAREHSRRTTWVVALPMLVELATGGLLLFGRWRPAGVPDWTVWAGAILIGMVWASTMLLQIPCHDRLAEGWDAAVGRRLVRGNWIRTVGWTFRGLLVVWMVAQAA